MKRFLRWGGIVVLVVLAGLVGGLAVRFLTKPQTVTRLVTVVKTVTPSPAPTPTADTLTVYVDPKHSYSSCVGGQKNHAWTLRAPGIVGQPGTVLAVASYKATREHG